MAGMRRWARWITASGALALGAGAFAQSAYEPLGPRVPTGPAIPGIPGAGGLREVDPGVADVDPLRTSLLNTGLSADFRTPVGFERVFVGADGRYYRISGSLVAAFDRSQYVADANGVYPEIPAGTVFYTGGLPPEALGNGAPLETLPTASLRTSGRTSNATSAQVDGRANADAGANRGEWRAPMGFSTRGRAARGTPDAALEPTVASDEAYRAARLAVLIARATGRG